VDGGRTAPVYPRTMPYAEVPTTRMKYIDLTGDEPEVVLTDAGTVRLHYLDVGSGDPPIVLLHAFPLSSAMWAPQLPALSASHRVIAPDLKGFGESDLPNYLGAYTMEGYVLELIALLEHLGLDRVVLGGISLGGYLAFNLLRARPDLIAALVLADTKPGADTPEVFKRRSDQQALAARGSKQTLVKALLPTLIGRTTLGGRPELVELLGQMMMKTSAGGYRGALEAMKFRPDSTDLLAGIKVPTLVLVGEEDGPVPPDSVREWQEQVPGSRLIVLPHAGHLSNLESPDAFTAAIVEFLDTLQDGESPA
jgi:3-oxoadipate enol-lactonase